MLKLSVGGEAFAKERAKATKSVHGEVLEVGFGTCLNLSHYPPNVITVATISKHLLRKCS